MEAVQLLLHYYVLMHHDTQKMWFFGSTCSANQISPTSKAPLAKIFACLRVQSALLPLLGNVLCMHSPYSMYLFLCLTPNFCLVSVHSAGLDSDHCLPACLRACLPVCVNVLFLHHHNHHLSVAPSSEGYEKSRSLNNIASMTGNALRLSPVTSPYGSPCPLQRSRSPIPSIL